MGSVCLMEICRTTFFRNVNIGKIIYRNLKSNFVPKKEVVEFYQKTFDVSEDNVISIMKKNQRLKLINSRQMSEVLDILISLNISKSDAINNPAIFGLDSDFIRKHWKILSECGFKRIDSNHLVSYFNIMKDMKIEELKKSNLLPSELNVSSNLLACFSDLPPNVKESFQCDCIDDNSNTLDKLRLDVMQFYLEWRFNIKKDRFNKIIQHYHQFRHRPLKDMEESISIAINEIKLSEKKILTYPYVISSDPANTRKILNEIRDFNGIDAQEVLRTRPGIIRTNYKSILEINDILKKYNFSYHLKKSAYILYTLKPETVELRIKEMQEHKFYKALATRDSSLLMILYKNRVMKRYDYINNTLKRKCPQLYQLLTSENNFHSKINKFGDMCSRQDVCHTVLGLLLPSIKDLKKKDYDKQVKLVQSVLSQHNNWLYIPLYSIIDTTNFLLQYFTREEIFNNCHIVLYSINKVKLHLSLINDLKNHQIKPIARYDDEHCISNKNKILNNICVGSFDSSKLSNNQLLSLILYSIEKEYAFTGDGIWDAQDNQASLSSQSE